MKKNKRKKVGHIRLVLLLILPLASIPSCALPDSSSTVSESDIYYSELNITDWDWDEATHEKLSDDEVIANTGIVFNTSQVQTLRIVIEPENWEIMEENLSDLSEELGRSTDFSSVDNPFFVPCEVFYKDKEWYKVGIRFKGNSSLFNANSGKLPFKLDFDEFEDTYTDIKNQRFYGFKQLNLKNNYKDESEMHEVVAGELLQDFGLVGAHSSFYELYLNVDGSDEDIYFGLYTLVEEIDDTVIDLQYDDDNGNLYKPEDDAATFADGTWNEDEYGLKTDHDESYADIALLYSVINDSTRTSNPIAWQASLEAVFDVDIFLKWLAANTVMQNWDTYGVMPHNYFLYNNPDTDKFEWISWDNNEALVDNNQCLSLNMATVDSDWPLVRYILDIVDYSSVYKGYVADFADTLFNEAVTDVIFDYYEAQIEDSVVAESSGYTFTSSYLFSSAISELKTHTGSQNTLATDYSAGTE